VHADALELRRAIPPRTVARLAAFACASVLLHALTLAIYIPEGAGNARRDGPTQPRVIRAVLAPLPPVETPSEAAAPVPPAKPAPDFSPGANEASRPLNPNKWYAASELDTRAEPLGPVELEYPEALEPKRIVGHVQLMLYIDENGVVRNAEVTESSPPGLFDDAAIRGWRSVKFAPAMKNGFAVKSRKLLELDFLPEPGRGGGAIR
jgi:protein TonB